MNTLSKKKIYYWANSTSNTDGEGILANNFLIFLKRNFKNYSLINLNKSKYKSKETFIFKYIMPFYGAILLWKYNFQNKRICYINYLPVWNFILILLLPTSTILGPVTGSINRKNVNFLIQLCAKIGIRILLYKYKKIIFSHDFFKDLVPKNKIKNCYFNFLLFNFQEKKNKSKKKFDFIFYLRSHDNKGNNFILNLIKSLSKKKYKICVLGNKISLNKKIISVGKVNINKAMKLISKSKYSIGSIENLYSFFVLDCLKYNLKVFVNKEFKIEKKIISSNRVIPIDFYNVKKSTNKIENSIKLKNKKLPITKNLNFNNYFRK